MGCETRKGGGELAFNEGVSFVRNTFSSPLVISGNSNGEKTIVLLYISCSFLNITKRVRFFFVYCPRRLKLLLP